MGGFAGHMMHLNDNPKLSFGQLKDIFNRASQGKLVGTEKTDGQNLFVSYSVRNKEARAVRNKGEATQGGLDPSALAHKFADRGNLTKTFVESFEAFERAVQSLPIETQIRLFGPDANNFYNAEIMDPSSPNVINYDTKSLVIHRVGHVQRDKQSGEIVPLEDSNLVGELETALEGMQDAAAEDDYRIEVNAIRNLEALSDGEPLHAALARLNSFMEENSLRDKSTVGDYIVQTMKLTIDRALPRVDEKVKDMILQRVLNQKGAPSITQIKKHITRDDSGEWSIIQEMIDRNKFFFKEIMYPLEDIIHDFAVEMLRGLESKFMLDNRREVARLKDEVSLAKKTIEDSGNQEAMDILGRQMEKLKDLENVSTATEGFVFDYDGNTYKFTGTFAPINQILGLFKYGRGNVPPLRKLEEQDDIELIDDESVPAEKADLALLPGSFKPPHKGHLHLASEYSELADILVILISNPASEKSIRKLPSGDVVSPDMAKDIWEIYLESAGIENARVIISEKPSPIGAVYDYLDELSDNGDELTIVLGTSTKGGDDEGRYADMEKYQGSNITVIPHALDPLSVGGVDLHASDMRVAIDETDIDTLKKYFFPEHLGEEEIATVVSIIKSQNQDPYGHELEEISSGAGGSVGGYSAPIGDNDENEGGATIMREEIVVEMKLRDLIRERIGNNLNKNKEAGIIYINERQKQMIEKYRAEHALRQCIRKILIQEKTDPVPHPNTGINQLSDLLKKIVPILSVGFKSLTTSAEQRASYRSHILNAVINTLAPVQAEEGAEDIPLAEEIDITLDDESDNEKFIDIEEPSSEEEEEKEAFETLPGQDLTGRNWAMKDFEKIENIILDSYMVLDDDKDQDLFYDYLLTNLKLYFDKFEEELSGTPIEPTTDEYEEEKQEMASDTGASASEEDLGALQEKAPPGMSDDVKALKRNYSDEESFKIAWTKYNEKQKSA